MAHFLFCISNQLERQFKLGFEFIVRFHVVAAHAEHNCASFDEIFVFIAKLHGLSGAAGGVVFRVEIQHHHLAQVAVVRYLEASCRVCFKFWEEFINDDGHECSSIRASLE